MMSLAPIALSPVPSSPNDGRPVTTRFCTPLWTSVYAPEAPKQVLGGPSGPGWHGPAPPLPASATQMSPFLATARPRGLSRPLATIVQGAGGVGLGECACALGAAAIAATAANANSVVLRLPSPPYVGRGGGLHPSRKDLPNPARIVPGPPADTQCGGTPPSSSYRCMSSREAATTASGVIPRCWAITGAGADAPYRSSPSAVPRSPTSADQPNVAPASSETRRQISGGSTSSR